jgi:hypothetical protein
VEVGVVSGKVVHLSRNGAIVSAGTWCGAKTYEVLRGRQPDFHASTFATEVTCLRCLAAALDAAERARVASLLSHDEAVEIARAAAKSAQPSYYAEPFYPHGWVVDAVLHAANGRGGS